MDSINIDLSNVMEYSNVPDIEGFTKLFPTNKHNILCIHINIRSLIKNFYNLEQIIQSCKSSIDIIVLSEVNISDETVSLFNLRGYTQHYELRKNRKGGVILLYVKNNLIFKQQKTKTYSFECIAGSVITNSKNNIWLCCVYKPPDTSKWLFTRELKSLLTALRLSSKNLFIIGDMNIDLKSNSSARNAYVSMMLECGLHQAISNYTRIIKTKIGTTKTCIDHIFVKSCEFDPHSAVLSTALADHCMTALALVCDCHIKDAPKCMKLYDNKRLYEKLHAVNWASVLSMSNPNDVLNFITDSLRECYNYAKKTVKQDMKLPNNIYNAYIKSLANRRDAAFSKWKKRSF